MSTVFPTSQHLLEGSHADPNWPDMAAPQQALPLQPLPDDNLASLVFAWANKTPMATALIDDATGKQTTYEELSVLIKQRALQWREILGASSDSNCNIAVNIAIMLENSVDFISHYFALAGLGCTIIPLNTRLTAHEAAIILQDASAKALLTSSERYNDFKNKLPAFTRLLTNEDFQDNWHAEPGFAAPELKNDRRTLFLGKFFPVKTEKNSLAALIYTSGTTGTPKGVMLSHHNLLSDAWANGQVIAACQNDVFITISPLFHVFGQVNVLLTAMMAGASVVLVRRFSPRSILKAIAQHRVSFMAAVPTMYQTMLAHLAQTKGAYDLSSLRVCHSGAAPMSVTLFHEVESIFGAPVQEGYGLSEASSIVTSNPLTGCRKPGSVGQPLPGLALKIIGEADQALAAEAVGEVCVKGPTVMQGYFQKPTLTQNILSADGWLRTGDMGYLDADGYLHLMDRADDLMNIGGIKVYPREVEEVLYRHPAVAAAVVLGVASKRDTHRVKAYVTLREGYQLNARELQAHCRSFLAPYKIPQSVSFVDEIPKGATGKILRHALRQKEPSPY
ncbi:MAG: AMP-binding protein [Vampirovibrionales bacterium]|nr:AMP-binding protein [Vampirovibrionales bacterium]